MAKKKAQSKRNKIIGSVSKKTIGKTVDSVSDFVDLTSQLIAEYFNRRYKIQKKVGEVRDATMNALFKLKQSFIVSVVEALFLATGLLALVVGVMIALMKVFPLEYILIFYGLVVCIGVLMRMKLK